MVRTFRLTLLSLVLSFCALNLLIPQIRYSTALSVPFEMLARGGQPDPEKWESLKLRAPGVSPIDDAEYALKKVSDPNSANKLWQRWVFALLALAVWLGPTAWIVGLPWYARVLVGAWVTAWGVLGVSYVAASPIRSVVVYWTPVALVGLGVGAWKSRNQISSFFKSFWSEQNKLEFVFLAWILLRAASYLLLLPVNGWDSRVIWMHRSKFAFLHGFDPHQIAASFPQWAHPNYSWFVAGLFSPASSFQNWFSENSAYASLFFLYTALVFLVRSRLLHLSAYWRCLVLSVFLLAFDWNVFEGYMDGWWAAFFALFALEFISSRYDLRKISILGWISLALASSFKNEAIAAIAVLGMVWSVRELHAYWTKSKRSIDRRVAITAGVALLPISVHKILIQLAHIPGQYGLMNQLKSQSWGETGRRFESTVRYLMTNVWFAHPSGKWLLGVAILGAVWGTHRNKRYCREMVFWTFLVGIPTFFIYIYTPFNLDWHLETSAYRVYLYMPALLALLASREA